MTARPRAWRATLAALAGNAWARSLSAALLAIGVVLLASWLAASVGLAVEGRKVSAGKQFIALERNLVLVTLVVLPLLFVALRLRLLERIHRIRYKLVIAYVVGQAAALAAAFIVAHYGNAMTLEPPTDGLFAVLLVYATTLSLALAFLLAGSMTSALARIRAGAAQIAEGDLETRIAVDTRDELAELADDLNVMATRLAAVARRERQMEQSRRELIAAVSHDLRTPLAAIRATIEAITDGVVTDEETIARYLRTMHAGTKELSRLIDDLFELSRIEAGALALCPEPASLADLLSETLEQLRPQAAARGVALRGGAAPDLPNVPLDARHIGRVLLNLVDNAVRHSPERGCVEVTVRRDGRGVRVEVIDSGDGIAPEDLPHVFERFYRGEKSRSREHGGAGLGLAISKGIIEAHGGAIWAEAHAPRGTRVAFTLPLTAPSAPRGWPSPSSCE